MTESKKILRYPKLIWLFPAEVDKVMEIKTLISFHVCTQSSNAIVLFINLLRVISMHISEQFVSVLFEFVSDVWGLGPNYTLTYSVFGSCVPARCCLYEKYILTRNHNSIDAFIYDRKLMDQ